jgi:membrane-associated protease RseP (regulator of RpoE activity)
VHPLFATGVAGLLANAYNMLPIGKLDGGRVAMAIAGRQAAASISNIFLLGLGFSLISSSSSPVTLFFALYVSLFLRSPGRRRTARYTIMCLSG